MSKKRRRTVTTVETHEVWIIRRAPPGGCDVPCATCLDEAGMLTPQDAAERAGVSQRTVYRWVEDGRIHFAETADGSLLVCLASLAVDG